MKWITDEVYQFLLKTILPASIVISMRLAAESRRKKINWGYALTSFIMGLGTAYLIDTPVRESMNQTWSTLTIVSIALVSDKIMNYILYRFRFHVIGDILIEGLKAALKKFLG